MPPLFKFACILLLCSHVLGDHLVLSLDERQMAVGSSFRIRASYRKFLRASGRSKMSAEDVMEDLHELSTLL